MSKQQKENQSQYSDDLAQIIPIRYSADGIIYYYMCNHTHGNMSSLIFPSGIIKKGEDPSKSAEEWLKHYTGYKSRNIRFIYRHSPDLERGPIFTYVAVVDELICNPQQKPVELTATELHKLILDNDIIDSVSLAALTILLFRSPKMTDYLDFEKKEKE